MQEENKMQTKKRLEEAKTTESQHKRGGIFMRGGKCFVNIRSLKRWAKKDLSEDSILREVLLSEKDILEPKVFLAKAEIWFQLVKRDKS